MTPSITLARLLQLGVPIQWQEAIAVARAASEWAERHNRRLTLDGCAIAADGTVRVGENDSDRIGPACSELQLVQRLLEGRPAPLQLTHLLASAEDALSIFPSERNPNGAPPTLASFLEPNVPEQIARLARRGLAASSGSGDSGLPQQESASVGAAPQGSILGLPLSIRPDVRTFGWRAGIALGLLLLMLALGSIRGAAKVSDAATAIVGVVEETAAAVGLTPALPHGSSPRHP